MKNVDPRFLQRRVSDFSGIQLLILFCAFTLLISIPVWTHPLPPLSDYINHLARMHVIATIGKDPNLAQFYEVNWQIIPNLTMDLVVPWLTRVFNIYLAGQIFTVVMFATIASGTLALNRALTGRWSVLPLVAFPLLYNYVFLIGLLNYLFGIGLALWATAIWFWLRERPWYLRITVSTLFAVALFFCHLSALGIYGIGILSAELMRLWLRRDEPWGRRLGDFVLSGAPFLIAVPLLAASPTLQLATNFEWEPRGKIDGLIYAIEVYSDIVAFGLVAIVGAGLAWAARHRLLLVHPFLWWLAAVSAVVYLALPRVMFATYMADQRVPIAIAFMLIACMSLELRHRLVRRGFLALLLVVLAARLIEVDVSWAGLSNTTNEFRSSTRRIARGAKVFVAYSDRTRGDDVRDLGLVHAACVAMIDRSALVTTAFTVMGKQILHVRSEYRGLVDTEDGTPPSVPQLVLAGTRPADYMPQFWRRWQEFDYLYVLFTEDEDPNPDPERLKLIHDGDRFQLYRIAKSKAAE
jgi:hypothetical protein